MKNESIERLVQGFMRAADPQPGEQISLDHDGKICGALAERFEAVARELGARPKLIAQTDDMNDYSVTIHTGKGKKRRFLFAAVPNEELAETFNMSKEEYEEFCVTITTLDYKRMTEAMKPLREAMSGGRDVLITGRDTRLALRLEDIEACGTAGVYNLPDGECFSAPVKDSVNGHILYGPSSYWGEAFEFIRFAYEDGKVVSAEAENDERTAVLNAMLDVDEGARYTGEFALAFNPYIREPVGIPLFDEKTAGSLHLAQGHCLKKFAANENTKSCMHWDLVHIQRSGHGGGEVRFDGQLVRKNGLFIPERLQQLNPENLKQTCKPSGLIRP